MKPTPAELWISSLEFHWTRIGHLLDFYWTPAGRLLNFFIDVYWMSIRRIRVFHWPSIDFLEDIYWTSNGFLTGRLLGFYWISTGRPLDLYWTYAGPTNGFLCNGYQDLPDMLSQ